MKVWDSKLKKYVDTTAPQKASKQTPSAYYPWNEAIAKEKEGETTHHEPVKEKKEQGAAFEYSVEIACAKDDLNAYQVGEFSLWATKEAACLSWNASPTAKGFTLLTTSVNIDEPKTLCREYFASSGNALIFDDVKPVKAGSGSHAESFIPIKPAIQVGEHLGWPTDGYFYYFLDDALMHEYKLLGEGKWAFQATLSNANSLTDELLSHHTYSFILLPWKINRISVARQHLLYLPRKMTLAQLEAITPTWLDDNACLLDVDSIVKTKEDKDRTREKARDDEITYTVQSGDTLSDIATQQGLTLAQVFALNPVYQNNADRVLAGDTLIIETEGAQTGSSSHTVKISSDTGKDETWSEIAAQYGLAPKALLNLNPMFEQDPLSLKGGDTLFVSQAKSQTVVEKRETLPPQKIEGVGQAIRFANAYASQVKDRVLSHNVVAVLQDSAVPLSTPIINVHQVNLDIDDTYLVFSDKDITIENFVKEAYLSTELDVIEHFMKVNSHLTRSFHQIVEGMPLVVSPWRFTHEDEADAIVQANELMTVFLTLTSEEREWFAKHHETTTNALLTVAASKLDVQEGLVDSPESTFLDLSHLLAAGGGVIAGAQVQGDKLSSKMKAFAEYSKSIAGKTKGIPEAQLKSNTDYKAWRKAARTFNSDMKGILSEFGNPAYVKSLQAKNINRYMNIDKRQLYKAKNFAKVISGIDMTALYKQSMVFTKGLKVGGVVATGLGLYGNGEDMFKTCITNNDVISEVCGRSIVKNSSSAALNVGGGFIVGLGIGLAPVSGGVSVVLAAGGAVLWGVYGGDISNAFGEVIERDSFELYHRVFD